MNIFGSKQKAGISCFAISDPFLYTIESDVVHKYNIYSFVDTNILFSSSGSLPGQINSALDCFIYNFDFINNKYIYIADSDNYISVFNLDGTFISRTNFTYNIIKIDFLKTRLMYWLFIGEQNKINIYNLKDFSYISDISIPIGLSTFCSDNKYIYYIDINDVLTKYDPISLSIIETIQLVSPSSLICDDKYIYVSNLNGLNVYSKSNIALVYTLSDKTSLNYMKYFKDYIIAKDNNYIYGISKYNELDVNVGDDVMFGSGLPYQDQNAIDNNNKFIYTRSSWSYNNIFYW